MGHEGHDHDDHDDHGGHPHTHGGGQPHSHPHTHGHAHGTAPHVHHAGCDHTHSPVATWVITCSDTRTARTDESGHVAQHALEDAGHTLLGTSLVKDEPEAIRAAIAAALAAGARAVILTGGTGITPRDQTIETVRPLLKKELPGFGELFRMLSFQEIGAAAWLSRATAGTLDGALLFALPGSPHAVRLGIEKLIAPELGHAVRMLLGA